MFCTIQDTIVSLKINNLCTNSNNGFCNYNKSSGPDILHSQVSYTQFNSYKTGTYVYLLNKFEL